MRLRLFEEPLVCIAREGHPALPEGMSLETFVMYVDAAVGLYAGRSISWNAIDHLKFTLDSLCE